MRGDKDMRFYFTVVYEEGCKLSGHNCTKFEIKDDFLILEGFDEMGWERQYWRFKYELSEIKEFHIEKMVESEEQYL